jgi:hypothetical protein
MAKTTVSHKKGEGLFPARRRVRIVVDESGIQAPPFANAPTPAKAQYLIRYGLPVEYLTRRVITALRDNVSTEPTGLNRSAASGQPETERQRAFADALVSYFAGHGFGDADDGLRWVHRDHGTDYRFSELLVGHDGVFRAKTQCGSHVIEYEIVDHSEAQRILDRAADEQGMV